MKGGGVMIDDSNGSTMRIMIRGGIMEGDSKRNSISIMKGGEEMIEEN